MNSYQRLLLANKAWVQEKIELKADYFENLAKEQRPDFLWIGCSDSRVPAEEITGTEPGEIFVHRNIANLVVHTDFNLLSVVQYAVEFLKVKHIIVCGHYGCGGIRAALSHQRFGLLNQWLRQIKDVSYMHSNELNTIQDSDRQLNRLVELNVIEQVQNLARTSIIQKTWFYEKRPLLHGWVYGLHDGILKELVAMDHHSKIDDFYRFDYSAAPSP